MEAKKTNEPILTMRHVTKTFPGVKALDDVHFNVYPGRVMALLGENGAGKSTLMKVLTGVYQPDGGEITYRGKAVRFSGPAESQDAGIAIIHQELNLIESLSVGENIFLGREPKKFLNIVDWKKLMDSATELLDRLKVKVSPRIQVRQLTIGVKQMVEIAKALSLDAELIIMDEPTDALTDQETEQLFTVIRALRAQGKSIVYISHRLSEIFEICDDVTIFRDGTFIDEVPVSAIDEAGLIEKMVGRRLEEQYPYVGHAATEEILMVKNLQAKGVKEASFSLKKGEILGVAGLMGAGRTELAKVLYGCVPIEGGQVTLEGQTLDLRSEKEALERGIAYVSEDRKKDGLVLGMNVRENISLSSLRSIAKGIHVDRNQERRIAGEYIESMSIKTPSADQRVKFLSGGNQQKVSIAKSLMTRPKVLILDEPTRGVDVGAKREIYELMNTFTKEGMSIIMISSEIPELLGMSDRILVMHEGETEAILDREAATQETIMRHAVGLKGAQTS